MAGRSALGSPIPVPRLFSKLKIETAPARIICTNERDRGGGGVAAGTEGMLFPAKVGAAVYRDIFCPFAASAL